MPVTGAARALGNTGPAASRAAFEEVKVVGYLVRARCRCRRRPAYRRPAAQESAEAAAEYRLVVEPVGSPTRGMRFTAPVWKVVRSAGTRDWRQAGAGRRSARSARPQSAVRRSRRPPLVLEVKGDVLDDVIDQGIAEGLAIPRPVLGAGSVAGVVLSERGRGEVGIGAKAVAQIVDVVIVRAPG